MNIGMAGEFCFVIKNKDGSVKLQTDYQKNLILNHGLDTFGGSGGFSDFCVVGTGNSEPISNQALLDNAVDVTAQLRGRATADKTYRDMGDNLYRFSETYVYSFGNLDNVNISEIGLASRVLSLGDYSLTTRALIKDSLGSQTAITVLKGEILEVYYKIHKVIDTRDKSFVVNVLDGNGGAVPYNVIFRPKYVGSIYNSVSGVCDRISGAYDATEVVTTELMPMTDTNRSSYGAMNSQTFRPYVPNSYKRIMDLKYKINEVNMGIRTISSRDDAFWFLPFQLRFGRVSDDAPLTKTDTETLNIPLEFSWGRYEGVL